MNLVLMNNQENSHSCHVIGCGASSPGVVIYSVHQAKDNALYKKWQVALNLDSTYVVIKACQRHFPAGAPTKNNPLPDSKLFNPLPQKISPTTSELNRRSRSPLTAKMTTNGNMYWNKKKLPAPVVPPPGSFVKLAPNATLIDLKKIKDSQDLSKPFRIEEVTVLIDDKDSVKVLDYGPKENNRRRSTNDYRGNSIKRVSSFNMYHDRDENYKTTLHKEFCSDSLGNSLDLMRRLKIDCNMALVDQSRRHSVQVHRTVLVAKSPYFYQEVYLRRKRRQSLSQFHCFVLPSSLNFDVVEAVVSFMYTDSLQYLLDKPSLEIRKVLDLFQMKEELRAFDVAVNHSGIKQERQEDKVFVLPFYNEEESQTKSFVKEQEEVRHEINRKKKRKHITVNEGNPNESYGKMKVSVQKIVERALNPFLGKIYELFGPSTNTLQMAKASQHIITLWHSDILLTKIFQQCDLTKFFSEVMSEVFKRNIIHSSEQALNDTEAASYIVETLQPQTGNSQIDSLYTHSNIGLDDPVDVVPDSGIPAVDSRFASVKNIPQYVHLISMYRFNICLKKKLKKNSLDEVSNKDAFMAPLLEPDSLQEDASNVALRDLVDDISQGLLCEASATQNCFQQINADLKRRVINDLDLYVNPSFHEELIMHIIVDQMDERGVLPFSLAIFLAKGCNFCRKKECKIEDLTTLITPNNPVCPDRQCIKRNLQCNICQKQMANSKSLARHKYSVHDIQTGDPTGMFICSHCGETFSKKWKLNIHERLHEERKKKVPCTYCNKLLHGSTALRKHINMVHETTPRFSCETCHKSFKRREALIVHKRIHSGEKPFSCIHCDYASETKGNLKAHIIRKHKVQYVSLSEADEQETPRVNTGAQSMDATIVAHSLSDGSFIITSGNPLSSIVP